MPEPTWDWLRAYQRFCAPNEAPDLFHFWCGLTALGHILNRKVWLDQFYFKLYPGQLMTVLVAPTAKDRKTTAINMVKQFLDAMPEDSVNVIADQVSPASLYDALDRGPDQDSIGLLVADELATLLSREKYADMLCTTITQLNTAGDGIQRRRMRSKVAEVTNPCLGLLGGTTQKGLARELPQAAVQAGFLGRVNLVFDDGSLRKFNALTEAPPAFPELKAALIRDLRRIAALRGPFTWSPEAKILYEGWYQRFRQNGHEEADDLQSGWYSRKHTHLLRVALILVCARTNELVLTAEALQEATEAIEYIEGLIPQAAAQVGMTPLTEKSEKVLAVLMRLGGNADYVPRHKIAAAAWRWCASPDLRLALESLVDAGKIEEDARQGGGKAYRVKPSKLTGS